MAKRSQHRIKFQNQVDVDRVSKAKGYEYEKESAINYKKNKKQKKKKPKKNTKKKKNSTVFDIIDLED